MRGLSMVRYTQSELEEVLEGRYQRGQDAIDDVDSDFEPLEMSDSSLSADSFESGSMGDNSTAALIDRDNMVAMGHHLTYASVGGMSILTTPIKATKGATSGLSSSVWKISVKVCLP